MASSHILAASAKKAEKKSSKRAANLSLSSDTLDEAKALDINVSQACDAFLRDLVKQEKARRWKLEYADFVHAYNQTVTDEGLPLDEWKTF